MDEGTLNDLLECSVCLERLDTSSKVLPCQHTFCKKCLEEILEKHKELRCPECRILVQAKVEDLPPNVLLMRILEGMKNAGNPVLKRVHRPNRSPNQIQANPTAYSATPIHHQHGTPDHRTTSNKHQNMQIAPHQPYAIAAYDYTSREAGDLSFKRGDVIILRKRIDNNWYQGECGGKQGVFPVSYVQIITPVPSHLPQCKALYDFRISGGDEEEGCLSFRKGDIINVIRRVDENWAEGKLDGRIGIFPLSFVELNDLARSLMKLSTNVQPGPSRLAPPTPTNEDTSPLIPTDHTRTVINQRRSPQMNTNQLQRDLQSKQPPLRSDSSSGGTSSSTTTPNASSSNASSSSSTAPSSPATPPPRGQQAPPPPQQLPPKNIAPKPDILINSSKSTPPQKSSSHSHVTGNRSPDINPFALHQDKEKRHSFSSITVPQQITTNHNRHSAEILACEVQVPGANLLLPERSRRNGSTPALELQLPATYVALYAYKPQKADELELKKGNIYMVTERCQDGWFKGTSNRTQKCGVFPGNYVVPARGAHVPSGSGSSSSTCPARPAKGSANQTAPELPPRAVSPAPSSISSSWHGQENNRQEIGRSSSQAVVGANSKDKVCIVRTWILSTSGGCGDKSHRMPIFN
nr:unnamed protein product [Callosobruchus analis]